MRNYNRFYTLLNVLPDADPVVIEAAYKALMKRYHPDIAADGSASGRAAELNQAYQTLRDPHRRAAYDADEAARQERHRAEVARALAPQPPRPAPPPRPEPVRTGQRVAAWIAAAGILFLAGAIYLLARGTDAPPTNQVAVAEPVGDQNMLRLAAEAFRDEPVDRAQVDKAVAEFRRIAGNAGMPAASAYSEHCFDVHSRTLATSDYDHCVSFDHVASRGDLRASNGVVPRTEPRFQPQSLVNRHVRAAELVSDDPGLIEARLFEIRRLTDNAVGRLPVTPPVELSEATAERTPKTTPPGPRQVAERQPPRTPPRPPAPRARAEQDFLEREGGIY